MTETITIKSERSELHSFDELPSDDLRDEFDYINGEDRYDPRFAMWTSKAGDDIWIDTGDMMRARKEWADQGWDGEHVDTFFSAVLVQFLTDETFDDGFVRIGLVTT